MQPQQQQQQHQQGRFQVQTTLGGMSDDSRPITSETRWPSFLCALLICPTAFRNWTPSIHSSTVNSTSRAKSCTWRMREDMTCWVRGVALGPMASMTFWVKLGSNLEAGIVDDRRRVEKGGNGPFGRCVPELFTFGNFGLEISFGSSR
jgi:hypothetical protein